MDFSKNISPIHLQMKKKACFEQSGVWEDNTSTCILPKTTQPNKKNSPFPMTLRPNKGKSNVMPRNVANDLTYQSDPNIGKTPIFKRPITWVGIGVGAFVLYKILIK